MKFYLLLIIAITILLRPAIPSLLIQINNAVQATEDANHSWLVKQLLKSIESEKEKIPHLVQAGFEITSLYIPESFICHFFCLLVIDLPSSQMFRSWQSTYACFIFQPPKISQI